MIVLILIAIPLSAFGIWFLINLMKENSIRRCSYGNKDIYNILKKPSDYTLLKKLFKTATSFEDRYFFSVSISRLFPLEILEQWVEEEPNSPDALLCYGARLVQWSWDARGYGRGAQVSEKKWTVFFDRLEKTRGILTKCTEKMPSDPTPWAYLIMVSTWSSDEFETRSYYFNQAIGRDSFNWAAHMHMIIAISEKWGGDNEDMVAFAEDASNRAPQGSDLSAISIKAYLEYWKYLDMFEDKPDEAKQFLSSDEIQSKAVDAYIRSLAADNHNETSVSIFARYNTSAWFWIVRDKKNLKQDLSILSNKIEDIHWRWAGPEGELNEARMFVK